MITEFDISDISKKAELEELLATLLVIAERRRWIQAGLVREES